ncbi:MAG TPA: hypothetical protein VHP30_00210, partial [Ignavibacteriales bacterium]|nr:hypothetical protein [Ignavibacteriales bacterium]
MKNVIAVFILLITFQINIDAAEDSVKTSSASLYSITRLAPLTPVETKLSFEPLKNQIDYN